MRLVVTAVVLAVLMPLTGSAQMPTAPACPPSPDPKMGVLQQILASDRVLIEGVGEVRLLGVSYIDDEPTCQEADVATTMHPLIGQRVSVEVDRNFWCRQMTPPDHGANVRLPDGRYLNDLPLLTGCVRMQFEPLTLERWAFMNSAWQQGQLRNLKYYRVR